MGRTNRWALTGFGLVLIYALAFLTFWFFNFQKVVVTGISMMPRLQNGEQLWACRAYWLVGAVKRGDIVVIREEAQNDSIIKRVYRMGGEVVDYPWIPTNYNITQGEYRVPEAQIYVLGDNREASEDSRTFGPLDQKAVTGKVVFFTPWSFIVAVTPILLIVGASFVCKPKGEGPSSPEDPPPGA